MANCVHFRFLNQIAVGILLSLSALNQASTQTQKFKAMAIVGLNASQIDGDNLYGFHKLGIQTGGRLSYQNSKILDVAMEMLYSQRGSAVRIFGNKEGDKISLQYIELPLLVSVRDWLIEEGGYYKVRAEAGLSYGYLFGVQSPGYNEVYFRQHDLSWLIAAGIQFTKRVGCSLRYTSSFGNMYRDPAAGAGSLQGYFLTLRGEFTL